MRLGGACLLLLILPVKAFSTSVKLPSRSGCTVTKKGPASRARLIMLETRGGASGRAQRRPQAWLRDAIFPVYGRAEITKFFSLGGLQFFIIFVLTLTRDMKDALVVTHCGAEAIAFLKVYGVLPAATLFMLYYAKLSEHLSKRALFYVTAAPLFLFYPVFAAFVYPNRAFLRPSWVLEVPQRLAYVSQLHQYWIFAVFYIVSEIYSSVSIGVLFWQFANDIVPVAQAKRLYPLLGQMASLAPIVAGQCAMRFASPSKSGAVALDGGLGYALNAVALLVTMSGLAIFGLYETSTAVARRERESDAAASAPPPPLLPGLSRDAEAALQPASKPKEKKKKLGLGESLRVLSRSRYLGYLAVMVLGYGVSISFTDVVWKSLLRRRYPGAVEYQRFMGAFSSILGATTFVVIFLGSNLIKIVGWKAGALATPLMLAVLAMPLFATVILGGGGEGGGPAGAGLRFVVLLGAVQALLSKATKYALFDPTTQMAYIPLDEESKVKGKAAIDGVGSRVGKAGASLLQQVLVIGFGSVLGAAPALAVLLYGVLGAWIVAATRLSVFFEEKTKTAAAAAGAGATAATNGDGSGHSSSRSGHKKAVKSE